MYKTIKLILAFFPLVWLLVFIFPSKFPEFWEWSWYFLVFLMFIRPIKDIFPRFKFLWKSVSLRKELWIISWTFAISHVIWYFLVYNLSISFILDSIFWDLRWPMGWGAFGFIVSLILLFTSNVFSMKKLWKYWKKIQRLSYLMFLFVAVHIALVKEWAMLETSIIIISYIILFIIAYIKKKRSYPILNKNK